MPDRARDGSGRAARGARTAMVIVAFVMNGDVVPIRVIVGVSVAFLPDSIFMMGERHALSARDRRQALDRNGQGQQQHGNEPEKRLRHQRAL